MNIVRMILALSLFAAAPSTPAEDKWGGIAAALGVIAASSMLGGESEGGHADRLRACARGLCKGDRISADRSTRMSREGLYISRVDEAFLDHEFSHGYVWHTDRGGACGVQFHTHPQWVLSPWDGRDLRLRTDAWRDRVAREQGARRAPGTSDRAPSQSRRNEWAGELAGGRREYKHQWGRNAMDGFFAVTVEANAERAPALSWNAGRSGGAVQPRGRYLGNVVVSHQFSHWRTCLRHGRELLRDLRRRGDRK